MGHGVSDSGIAIGPPLAAGSTAKTARRTAAVPCCHWHRPGERPGHGPSGLLQSAGANLSRRGAATVASSRTTGCSPTVRYRHVSPGDCNAGMITARTMFGSTYSMQKVSAWSESRLPGKPGSTASWDLRRSTASIFSSARLGSRPVRPGVLVAADNHTGDTAEADVTQSARTRLRWDASSLRTRLFRIACAPVLRRMVISATL
jgi:hypothetical protein